MVQVPPPTRATVQRWVAGYEAAWRMAGTDTLQSLFAGSARYLHSPYAESIIGLAAISEMWEAEREGPDEVFALETEIVAVEGDTAVVRAFVRYGDPVRQEYRDLWVIQFDRDGLCISFEEWPFWPDKPWSGGVTLQQPTDRHEGNAATDEDTKSRDVARTGSPTVGDDDSAT